MALLTERLAILAALVALLVGGCRVGDDSALEARRCALSTDCANGWQCEDGWCQAPVDGDAGDVATDPQPEAGDASDTAPDALADADTGAPDLDAAEVPEEPDDSCAFGAYCGDPGVCQDGLCCDEASICASPMVPIPGRTLQMGCTLDDDPGCRTAEQPEHSVSVPDYEIDVTEVSNAQYVRFLNDNGNLCEGNDCVDATDVDSMITNAGGTWRATAGAESLPVVEVTWYGARSYCGWAGKRLCVEAEWELAARGPDDSLYPWGDSPPTCAQARIQACPGRLEPIGATSQGVSGYGVYDLGANVREWVEDDWHATYDAAPEDGTAWLDEPRADGRVIRGGDADSDAPTTRAAFRAYNLPDDSHARRGFRCCR